jgi:RNA recognition motif-containing protein
VERRLSAFGAVEEVTLVLDAETGMSLGFGFATFATAAGAQWALAEGDGIGIDGHAVQLAAPGARLTTSER